MRRRDTTAALISLANRLELVCIMDTVHSCHNNHTFSPSTLATLCHGLPVQLTVPGPSNAAWRAGWLMTTP